MSGSRGGWRWPAVLAVCSLTLAASLWSIGSAAPPDVPLTGPAPDLSSRSSTLAPVPGPAPDLTAEPDEPVATWSTHPATVDDEPDRVQDPTALSIPRLSIKVPVVPTTVRADGQMSLPDRPTELGWYAYGPRPGDDVGSAVLGGHLDSRRYGVGPLVQLRRLERGDQVVVTSKGGRQVFVVTDVQRIRKRALPLRELFRRTGPAELRIITCGGPYEPRAGGYQDNVVVTAEPK